MFGGSLMGCGSAAASGLWMVPRGGEWSGLASWIATDEDRRPALGRMLQHGGDASNSLPIISPRGDAGHFMVRRMTIPQTINTAVGPFRESRWPVTGRSSHPPEPPIQGDPRRARQIFCDI